MCSMRKFYLILALILSFSLATWSQEIVVDSICYYGDYMGKATIAAFQSKNLKGDIVIPSTVYAEGEPLTVYKFEQYAFSECTNIRSVTIPSSVNETLYDCGYEFYGCTSLEEVRLSPNMQVLQGTFIGCKALRKIVIPEGVKYNPAEIHKIAMDLTLVETSATIPGEAYVRDLLTQNKKMRGCDPMETVKGLAVEYFIVQSGYDFVSEKVKNSWPRPSSCGTLQDFDTFISSCLALADCRNLVAHPDDSEFWSNVLTTAYKNYYRILESVF
jgi:hypothetical protein